MLVQVARRGRAVPGADSTPGPEPFLGGSGGGSSDLEREQRSGGLTSPPQAGRAGSCTRSETLLTELLDPLLLSRKFSLAFIECLLQMMAKTNGSHYLRHLFHIHVSKETAKRTWVQDKEETRADTWSALGGPANSCTGCPPLALGLPVSLLHSQGLPLPGRRTATPLSSPRPPATGHQGATGAARWWPRETWPSYSPRQLPAPLFPTRAAGSVWPGCRTPWGAGQGTWPHDLFLIYTVPHRLTKRSSQRSLSDQVQHLSR